MVWQTHQGVAVARVVIPESFQGFRGVAHGGIIAALLDDAMWHAIWDATGLSTFTVDLQTRYHHPTPVNTLVEVEAQFETMRHRVAAARATATDVTTGKILARSSGRFMPER